MQMQYFLISEINNKDNWSNKGQLLGEVNENWNEPSWGVIATWITGERELLMMSGEDGRAGEITAGLCRSYRSYSQDIGQGWCTTYNIMFSPAWCHLHSCIMCLVLDERGGGGCMCICVTCVLSLQVFASFILIFSVYCLWLSLLLHRTKIQCVLSITLTSIHPIQLPHPWMQWLRPYQWEILKTQKVGQIKNPPSVCLSSSSSLPHKHPFCGGNHVSPF